MSMSVSSILGGPPREKLDVPLDQEPEEFGSELAHEGRKTTVLPLNGNAPTFKIEMMPELKALNPDLVQDILKAERKKRARIR